MEAVVPVKTPILTGVPDTDLLILLGLDDRSLTQLCQSNQYTRDLCDREDFWMKKIKQLGIPVRKCQNCTTFKESYIWYKEYLNNHVFVILDDSERGYGISFDLKSAYSLYISHLRRHSEFNDPIESHEKHDSYGHYGIFPPLENVSKLVDLYQNILKTESGGGDGLFFLRYGDTFTFNKTNSAIVIIERGRLSMLGPSAPLEDVIVTDGADIFIAKDIDQFLNISNFEFFPPKKVIIATIGLDDNDEIIYKIFKELDEQTKEYLLRQAKHWYHHSGRSDFRLELYYAVIDPFYKTHEYYTYDGADGWTYKLE